MRKFFGIMLLVLVFAVGFTAVSLAEITKEDITGKAKSALADKGIAVEDCNIVYDEGNKAWEGYGAYISRTPNDNNHGYLPHGVLENQKYQAVYFDFYDDGKKDVWVFVDLMTGDVIGIYEKK